MSAADWARASRRTWPRSYWGIPRSGVDADNVTGVATVPEHDKGPLILAFIAKPQELPTSVKGLRKTMRKDLADKLLWDGPTMVTQSSARNRWQIANKKQEGDPPPHPIMPLVKVWQAWRVKQPPDVEPETRRDSRVLSVIRCRAEHENADRLLQIAYGDRPPEQPAQLSLFLDPHPLHVPLLDLVDGTGMPLRDSGRGAPLEARLTIAAVLVTP